jgi:hypothetical protein
VLLTFCATLTVLTATQIEQLAKERDEAKQQVESLQVLHDAYVLLDLLVALFTYHLLYRAALVRYSKLHLVNRIRLLPLRF